MNNKNEKKKKRRAVGRGKCVALIPIKAINDKSIMLEIVWKIETAT